MKLHIIQKLPLTRDTFLFDLKSPFGEALPRFAPGAHVTIDVPNGMRRTYSLCGDPHNSDRYQVAVKREEGGRGGSASLVDESNVGDVVEVSEPNNVFKLTSAATELLFVAGGIGITPILSMVRHVSRHTDLPWSLYYCTRNADQTAFSADLKELPTARGKIRFHHSADQKPTPFEPWSVFEKPKKNCHVYCCGPVRLMDAIKDTTGHWPLGSIHFETFGSEIIAVENRAFLVRLESSGERINIPTDQTIVEALRASGCSIPTSCESGTCGTCRTRLVSGIADHRDMVLQENEKASQIIPCVSRALSEELVLGL